MSSGLQWSDVATSFVTILFIFGVAVGVLFVYNLFTEKLWLAEGSLKNQGVEKGEDGVWRIKTSKNMADETYKDRTQAGFVKAFQASSFSNPPAIVHRKGKKAADSNVRLAACYEGRRKFSVAAPPSHKRKVIFSAIQPTGVPHLGNLLGALSNWVDMQNNAEGAMILYAIAGYHAVTMPQDPKRLREDRMNTLASLLAVGVDPSKATLFEQEQVPEHTELAWLLNCTTPMGRLQRMTTWKGKLAVSRNANSEEEVSDELLNLGLFAYPVLQTADIILYKGTHVPVGEDQQQHLELARDLAESFNKRYKRDVFPLPQHIITPAKRILSLRDPTQKMSKSAPNHRSRILITDEYKDIQSKIKSAVTDSSSTITWDPQERPGVANLLTILATCTNRAAPEAAEEYAGKDHAALKADVIEAVESKLGPIRSEFHRLSRNRDYLQDVIRFGTSKARRIAAQTMGQVKRVMGLDAL